MLGIALMLAFCAIIPVSDTIAKILVTMVPLIVIVLARFIGQAVMSLPSMLQKGVRVSPRVFGIIVLRAAIQALSTLLLYLGLRYMPLADAVAICFVFPFLILLMGRFFLGEQVGIRRLSACLVGFFGTLLVIQPSFISVGAAAFLPLASAVTFALYTLITKHVVRYADPLTIQGIGGIAGTVILLVFALIFGAGQPDLQLSFNAGWQEISLLIAIGLIGSGAHYLMTLALRYASASMLGSVQYIEIPFATLMGWLVFNELPNRLSALGILIIIGAGLFIVFRERQLMRRAAQSTPVQPMS